MTMGKKMNVEQKRKELCKRGYVVIYLNDSIHIADPLDDKDGFYLNGADESIIEEAYTELSADISWPKGKSEATDENPQAS